MAPPDLMVHSPVASRMLEGPPPHPELTKKIENVDAMVIQLVSWLSLVLDSFVVAPLVRAGRGAYARSSPTGGSFGLWLSPHLPAGPLWLGSLWLAVVHLISGPAAGCAVSHCGWMCA